MASGLVINRKKGSLISINNGELIIEIVDVQGKYVKLRLEASKDIRIERMENADRTAKNTACKD